MATGISRRDADLRKPRPLSVTTFPRWTFRADGIEADGDGAQVRGVLAVRAACPVVWAARLGRRTEGSVVLTATTRLDRRDTGVRAPRLIIGREIDVTLELTFRRSPPTA